MVYLYDNAIVDDLKFSFNSDNMNSVVKVISPENVINIAAQVQNDELTFPIVALTRNPEQLDNTRINFTASHTGVVAGFENASNELYYENVLPITLSYNLTILATNTADMDEIIRELLFKYTRMYYLTITLPYEVNRKIRFGISIPRNTEIEKTSSSSEYLQSGTLYQSIIPLTCEGAVLVSYTPVKLRQIEIDGISLK